MQPKKSEASHPSGEFGAFSSDPPWSAEVGDLKWLPAVGRLRSEARKQIPLLLKQRLVPPGTRVTLTGIKIGYALAAWRIIDKPASREASRNGLARRLRNAFEDLGPTYIKLGQIISSGEGIFPSELVSQFRLLRDQVRPETFATVRTTIETELNASLEDIFIEFDQQALAAASIAQVHRARLRSGAEVVVKVQRSDVDKLVRADLAAMSWFAPHLIGRIPVTALANPPALVQLFAETIVEELDFRLEAANMLDIARMLAESGQKSLIVPRPHPTYVTRKVLVMERLKGFPWDSVEDIRNAGVDTAEVIRSCMVAFFEGSTMHGVFHGDLHGGNLLVRDDGKVALLDYGITGRLSEPARLAFLRLLVGGSMNNVELQMEALRDLGALPPDTDIRQVIEDLGLDGPPIDPTNLTPDELTAQVREITKALLGYGARMPKELMLFIKNMLFLDSSMPKYAPDVDIFSEIVAMAAYFTSKYGEKITHEVGLDPRLAPVDLNGIKGSLGLDLSTDRITYRQLSERRELIRKRMTERPANPLSRLQFGRRR